MPDPSPSPHRGNSHDGVPIRTVRSKESRWSVIQNSFSQYGASPLAQASIAQDLREAEDEADGDEEASQLDGATDILPLHDNTTEHAMVDGRYRRPSFVASGPRGALMALSLPHHGYLSEADRDAALADERSLLRDNELLLPKHPRQNRRGSDASESGFSIMSNRLKKTFSRPGLPRIETGVPAEYGSAIDDDEPTETTTLLGSDRVDPTQPYGGLDDPDTINKKWEEAVIAGKIHTTWQREAKVLARYSAPLIVTFILQYSLTMTSVFTVGHIGKIELGAVSLASMTANITGYAVYQGLATALDTLCAQAYGSGKKALVGLQLQRMILFLWVMTIPISIVWLAGEQILLTIVPDKRTAHLAGLYLKILVAGAPGYAVFESGKRFVQAQGQFSVTLYVLLICAPLNALMNWLFVWKFGWGFIGAPIAVSITENLMPLCLIGYIYFFTEKECWGGFSVKALHNWLPMIKLALPGLVMVLAEWLAFEILTLSSSWLGSTQLAAQSVLSTVTALTFQLPFPMSVAASTRIANLIGATLGDAGKVAARVSLVASIFVGGLNVIVLSSLRSYIPYLFTSDRAVAELVANVLPVAASFQLIDAFATNCNGILRGIGKPEIGGIVNLFAYYAVALPISFGTAFGLHWELYGLWTGPAIGLAVVAIIEGWFLYRTSWDHAVELAKARNETG